MYLNENELVSNPILHQFLNESDLPPLSDEELKKLCQQNDFSKYSTYKSYDTINLVTLLCIQGLLAPLKELAGRAPNDFKRMIEADSYHAFQCAAENGYLPILQYLARQMPDKLQTMIEALNYYAFRWAAANGHLPILQYLVGQAPDKLQMMKAHNYYAFRWAAKNGHLPILEYLGEQAPDKLQVMIEQDNYYAFRCAAENGHLPILEYLAEKTSDNLQAMIASPLGTVNKDSPIVRFIFEKASGISEDFFKGLVKVLTPQQKKILNTLRYESSMIHHALYKNNLLPKELLDLVAVSSLFPFFKPAKECLGNKNTNSLSDVAFLS